AVAGDVTQEQPSPRPVESLAGLLDEIGAVGEGSEGGGAVPAAREMEPEAGPGRRGSGAGPDGDLREEGGRAGRGPVGSRVTVEARPGRSLAVERDRVAEVRIRRAGRPRQRAAVPDEAPRPAHVAGPVVTEDEAERGDLVDAGEQPVDVRPAGVASR